MIEYLRMMITAFWATLGVVAAIGTLVCIMVVVDWIRGDKP